MTTGPHDFIVGREWRVEVDQVDGLVGNVIRQDVETVAVVELVRRLGFRCVVHRELTVTDRSVVPAEHERRQPV